jgi:hypothetical protein
MTGAGNAWVEFRKGSIDLRDGLRISAGSEASDGDRQSNQRPAGRECLAKEVHRIRVGGITDTGDGYAEGLRKQNHSFVVYRIWLTACFSHIRGFQSINF